MVVLLKHDGRKISGDERRFLSLGRLFNPYFITFIFVKIVFPCVELILRVLRHTHILNGCMRLCVKWCHDLCVFA